jgi:hypothetical protein
MITPQEVRETATRLLDATNERDVDGDVLASELGVTDDTYAGFYNACREINDTGGLHFSFSGDMKVGSVSRQSDH